MSVVRTVSILDEELPAAVRPHFLFTFYTAGGWWVASGRS